MGEVESGIKSSLDQECKRKEERVVEQIRSNTKAFYSYANSKRKSYPKTGPLVYQGEEFSDDLAMANIMNKQFSSVFTEPVQFPLRELALEGDILEDIEKTEDDVIEAISQLNRSSSPGPDGVTSQFLIECRLALAPILKELFNKSLDLSVLPSILKLAIITPLFKGGSESDPANHRPVSVTSYVSKVEERITLKKVTEFLI